jgi:hypothetical protein
MSFFQTKNMLIKYLEKHNINNEEQEAIQAIENLPTLIWNSVDIKRERFRELFNLSLDYLRFFQNKKEIRKINFSILYFFNIFLFA